MNSIKDISVANKTVFVRSDLDVPLEGGNITDDSRLSNSFKTLDYLVDQKAKVIVGSHLGRPRGKVVDELSLDIVAPVFKKHFSNFKKLDDCVGSEVADTISQMEGGEVILLENLRFNPGEEANNSDFAGELASLAEIYVNDCFAVSHRQHASVATLPKLLPAYAGLALEEEVANLSRVLKDPARPLVVILGGAKLDTKLPLVATFRKLAEAVLLGGKLALELGLESTLVDGKDLNSETIASYVEIIGQANTIVWNGPVGVWEEEKYRRGTEQIAQAIANSSAFTVVGGGDTVAAIKSFGMKDKFSFVSLGGGAMLTFLAGGAMPGLYV